MNAKLLRDTLELTLAADDTFPQRFYNHLFEAHPQLRDMFTRNSRGAQNKMFAQKIAAIVDHVDDPSWLDRELRGLATSHAGYGVTAEMYPWVGDALIATVREACGDKWSAEAEHAWTEAYGVIAKAILAATP